MDFKGDDTKNCNQQIYAKEEIVGEYRPLIANMGESQQMISV